MNKYEILINGIKEKYNPNKKTIFNLETFLFWFWERKPKYLDDMQISQYFGESIVLEWINNKGRVIVEINEDSTRYNAKIIATGEIFSKAHIMPLKITNGTNQALEMIYG